MVKGSVGDLLAQARPSVLQIQSKIETAVNTSLLDTVVNVLKILEQAIDPNTGKNRNAAFYQFGFFSYEYQFIQRTFSEPYLQMLRTYINELNPEDLLRFQTAIDYLKTFLTFEQYPVVKSLKDPNRGLRLTAEYLITLLAAIKTESVFEKRKMLLTQLQTDPSMREEYMLLKKMWKATAPYYFQKLSLVENLSSEDVEAIDQTMAVLKSVLKSVLPSTDDMRNVIQRRKALVLADNARKPRPQADDTRQNFKASLEYLITSLSAIKTESVFEKRKMLLTRLQTDPGMREEYMLLKKMWKATAPYYFQNLSLVEKLSSEDVETIDQTIAVLKSVLKSVLPSTDAKKPRPQADDTRQNFKASLPETKYSAIEIDKLKAKWY
jgi:hypothetical protein